MEQNLDMFLHALRSCLPSGDVLEETTLILMFFCSYVKRKPALLFLCQKETALLSKKKPKMKVKLKVKQVNKNTQNSSMATSLPVEAVSSGGSFDWGKLLKILIAILTAIAGSIGLASCVN